MKNIFFSIFLTLLSVNAYSDSSEEINYSAGRVMFHDLQSGWGKLKLEKSDKEIIFIKDDIFMDFKKLTPGEFVVFIYDEKKNKASNIMNCNYLRKYLGDLKIEISFSLMSAYRLCPRR